MIRAIVFDCFGVLTTDGWLPFKQKHFGGNKQRFDEASNLNQRMGAGMLSPSDFTRYIADLAKVTPEAARDEIDGGTANQPLFDYIATELKPSYKIGLLSNAGSNALSKLFIPEQIELFDVIALSYEMGVVKPERQAYEHVLNRLGVAAEEAVFVDDQERHCTGAREAGMHAICYRDFDQFRRELTQLLGDTED